MQVSITGRHIAVTEALRRRIERRLARVTRYGVRVGRVQVVLAVEKYRHLAEVIASVNGGVAQATVSAREMYAAIDAAVEKVARQVEKRKAKQKAHKPIRRKPRLAMSVPRPDLQPPGVTLVRPVLSPLMMADALARLEREDGGVLVFLNAAVSRVQVLRRLGSGAVELIDPQLPTGATAS